jgi:hypothetical protein
VGSTRGPHPRRRPPRLRSGRRGRTPRRPARAASPHRPAAVAAAGGWQRPVSGPLTRPFDYAGDPFVAGRHRGVDLAARPGTPVRSACSGRVAFAGVAGANGPAVSVRCGRWRVAYLPLRTLAVRRGAHVAARRPPRHRGSVGPARRPARRRSAAKGSRWGYVNPLPFFATAGEPPLAPPTRPLRRPTSRPLPATPPRSLAPRPSPQRRPLGAPQPAPLRRPLGARQPGSLRRPSGASQPGSLRRPSGASQPGSLRRPEAPPARPPWPAAVAPWPAWAGLALVLAGSCGAGVARPRRGARPRRRAVMARVARE